MSNKFFGRADLYTLSPDKQSWIRLTDDFTNIRVEPSNGAFRVLCSATNSNCDLVKTVITPDLEVTKTSTRFRHWVDADAEQMYGVGFATTPDADCFDNAIEFFKKEELLRSNAHLNRQDTNMNQIASGQMNGGPVKNWHPSPAPLNNMPKQVIQAMHMTIPEYPQNTGIFAPQREFNHQDNINASMSDTTQSSVNELEAKLHEKDDIIESLGRQLREITLSRDRYQQMFNNQDMEIVELKKLEGEVTYLRRNVKQAQLQIDELNKKVAWQGQVIHEAESMFLTHIQGLQTSQGRLHELLGQDLQEPSTNTQEHHDN